MKPQKANIDYHDVIELSAYITSTTDEYEEDGDDSIVEDALVEQYSIDFDTLHELLRVLTPMITVSQSWFNPDVILQGFSDKKNKMYLLKTEVKLSQTPE